MCLGFPTDQGVLGDNNIRDSLRTTYSIGDQPDQVNAWTDEDVHGAPNERRQAEGIGFSTGTGDSCVAFGDWQDQPAAPLFEDKSLRVEPFADPSPQADGSLLLELPDAEVDVSELTLAAGTAAGPELASAIEGRRSRSTPTARHSCTSRPGPTRWMRVPRRGRASKGWMP